MAETDAVESLDKMIKEGYSNFLNNNGYPFTNIQHAYTQGFLDGLRAQIDELAEAYIQNKDEKNYR